MAKPKSPEARDAEALQSAGRVMGHCWVEHPHGGAHCTRLPGHYPRTRHTDYYNRVGQEYD